MTNPLVSIIVPVYNAQNSVARCLESICGQTYQELEIIVLNDGSMDDSLTICNQFCAKDPRVTVVDKENEGLSITRNVGMRLAQGKYLQFVDSDDHLAPDFTQRMVTAAEQYDATLVISPYWMEIPRDIQKEQLREKVKAGNPEDIAKKKLRRKKPEVEYREYGFLPAGVYDQKSYALHLMEKPVTFFYNVVWNKIYRRDVLNEEPGYYYVQNPQSICHTQINLSTIMQNRLQMIDYYKALYTKLGLYEEVQTQLHASLLGLAESVSPTIGIQKALSDAAEYWYAFFAGSDEEAELAAERSGRKTAAKKKQKLGTE